MPEKLLEGFKQFKAEHYACEKGLMPTLVREGQNPDYFIISCIDSRANPATIFKAEPGTFFAHKAMGAIVRPYKKGTALAASLEFAIKAMNIHTVIVLGHTQCGAVSALCCGAPYQEVSSFLEVADKALERAKENKDVQDDETLRRQAEYEVVLQSVNNLKTYPSVAEALESGQIKIKAWIFDMQDANLLEYDETKQRFEVIKV